MSGDQKSMYTRLSRPSAMHPAPSLRTINEAITDPRERHAKSSTWLTHDRAPGHTRRYSMYMVENETTVLVAYLEDLETGSSLARWI
jgi:beta-mannosidase